MSRPEDNFVSSVHPEEPQAPGEEAVTLEDLARAFAAAAGQSLERPETPVPATSKDQAPYDEASSEAAPVAEGHHASPEVPVTPRSILEALLFVGHPRNEPLVPARAAEIMRGVTPEEVASLVAELNTRYSAQGRPFRVVFEQGGYRLKLLPEFDHLREGFFGKVRQVRLSQQALEVLAIVAYRQPVTVKEVNRLRGKPSGGILAQLVKRDLLQVVPAPENAGKKAVPHYCTTQRFLDLFGLESPKDLPRLEGTEWEQDPSDQASLESS